MSTDQSLKVAYVLESFPRLSETFIVEEMASLRRCGVGVRAFVLSDGADAPVHPAAQELIDDGCVVRVRAPGKGRKLRLLLGRMISAPAAARRTLRLGKRLSGGRWVVTGAMELARAIAGFKPDRVHAHFALAPAHWALAAAAWLKTPFSFTAHGHDIFTYPPRDYPLLAQHAQQVITVSNYNRDYLSAQLGVPARKIAVVRCGIDTSRFCCDEKPISPGRPVVILCVARLHPIKGHAHVLKAAALLQRAQVPLELWLAGDGPLAADLKRMAKSLGLGESVKFLGAQTAPQVLALYEQCHVHVLGSLSEGLPISVVEAMSCSRPVVATDVRGVGELVQDRVTGRLVAPEDPAALSAAVKWIVEHPSETRAMVQRGRRRVLDEFDRARCTRRLIDVWMNRHEPQVEQASRGAA
jgi:glycosyltransferase involved in cell wall biosynthesis